MLVRPNLSPVRRTRRGFTLIEVLAVVAILVILASVLAFSAVTYLEGAKVDQATIQAQNIQKAATAYYTKSGGSFPESLEMLIVANEVTPMPLLDGGVSAITDPWGNRFVGQPIEDSNGAVRFVVTTTHGNQTIQWPRQ